MSTKGLLVMLFILLLTSTVPVLAAEEEHEHHGDKVITLDGYEITLLTEPEDPKVDNEVHLVVHIEREGQSVSGLHVELEITKMEMHSDEMEEHLILSFEDGHAHEEDDRPGHYALHHKFEEEGTYMIRIKVEDVGVTDAFHITVGGSFHKGAFMLPLIFIAISIGGAALAIVGFKMKGA